MAMTSDSRELRSQMNVTPLVDVLLVLLIIFMITPRTDPHGLDAKLPQDSPVKTAADKPPDSTIVLRVLLNPDNHTHVRVNQEDVAWADLPARLRDIYKLRATKVLFVKGDKEVEFLHIARAIDAARSADPDIAIGLMNQQLPAD